MQNLIDVKMLKKWQDEFCSIVNIYAYFVDAKGHPMTEMSGPASDVKKIRELISEEHILNLVHRISKNDLEEQAVETTALSVLRLGAVSVRQEQVTMGTWVLCAVLAAQEDQPANSDCQVSHKWSYQIEECKLYHVMDLLRDVTAKVLTLQYAMLDVEAENRRSRYSENEMGASLRKHSAITEIVQMLESDEAIEMILSDVLQSIGSYLPIDTALICQLHKENGRFDIAAQWYRQGIVPRFDRIKDIPCINLLYTEKTAVFSAEIVTGTEEQEAVKFFGAKAMIVIPIFIHNKLGLQACFCNYKGRKWKSEEVDFLKDAVRIVQSILTRRIQKNSLTGSYASLETILDNIGSSIYVRDIGTKELVFANRSMQRLFAKEIKENLLYLLFEQNRKEGDIRGKCEVYHEDRERWYDLYYTDIQWVDGSRAALFAIYDITEKKQYQKKIEQQAYTDFLTGLYNRFCCEKDLARYIDEAGKHNKNGALLYIDLDDFKHINDGLGHQYGDMLLKSISHSLQKVEEIENACYRVGGDEFIIIIPPHSYPKFETILNNIKDIFSKPWLLNESDYYCTMSMGVVQFPIEGESVHELIKKADIAMYESKKLGKNRITIYNDSIDSVSGRRLDMEKNMRDAAVEGCKEFEIYFQPIIDIQLPGTPCTGAEALIRWNNRKLGIVSPAEFIPLAEYLGLINPIGNYVLKQACKYCKEWNSNGYPHYKVNVNLSVVQLLQMDIVEIVAETIMESGINPRNLTLEVTESLAINDMERMKAILGRIKKLGVRIALDDFGTGYSSLNYIREIPFDVIKVDQSFVKDLAEDAYSQSFIRMVAELADAIDVSICVEGIETQEQFKVLEDMKVRLVQGYFFDKPLTREQFEEKYLPAWKELQAAASSL